MVLPLKLVSFNTYLISKPFNQQRITHPERRAAAIQNFLQQHDICFLQEVWGAGLPDLLLSSKTKAYIFELPRMRKPFLGSYVTGTLAEVIYTMSFLLLQTGGLMDVVKPSAATCVYRAKHTFSKSRSKSQKGVEATLWTNIAKWNKEYDLLVLNTHTDPWHPENRALQVNEMVEFLQTTLKQLEQERPQQVWSKTGVLILGDFNVKAPPPNGNGSSESGEYENLFVSRGWKDFFASNSKENTSNTDIQQNTYSVQNSLAVYPVDSGRIDYIFGIEHFANRKFLPLVSTSHAIVTQPHGQEMSDHYPLVIDLVPRACDSL